MQTLFDAQLDQKILDGIYALALDYQIWTSPLTVCIAIQEVLGYVAHEKQVCYRTNVGLTPNIDCGARGGGRVLKSVTLLEFPA